MSISNLKVADKSTFRYTYPRKIYVKYFGILLPPKVTANVERLTDLTSAFMICPGGYIYELERHIFVCNNRHEMHSEF